jgi:hypothetical protein
LCLARRSILDDADLGQLEVTACAFLITNDAMKYSLHGFYSLVWEVVVENPGVRLSLHTSVR